MATPSLLESVKSHLQFLGYSFSESEDVWIGRHGSKPLIGISDCPNGLMFTAVYFATVAAGEDDVGFLRFANDGNTMSRIARFAVYKNDHLTVEAWFPDHYERRAFDEFFQKWLDEIDQFFKDKQTVSRKYLQ